MKLADIAHVITAYHVMQVDALEPLFPVHCEDL